MIGEGLQLDRTGTETAERKYTDPERGKGEARRNEARIEKVKEGQLLLCVGQLHSQKMLLLLPVLLSPRPY
jgi:hypothetical protein